MSDDKTLSQAPGVQFEARLKQGELQLQWCKPCNRAIFYPRTLCPHCGSTALEWRRASGRGTVYSTTIVRQRPDKGGDYNVAIVELAEGVRMMTRVEGVAPPEVRIGMAVQAEIVDMQGAPLVVFRPEAQART